MSSGLLRLLGRIASLGPPGWRDCARAVLELALANRRLGSRTAAQLLASAPAERTAASGSPLPQAQAALVARVAFVIPRAGAHVPWRSDCLVQALAAQRWLAGRGIGSEICIGVRKPADSRLDAHAWLKVAGTVVTGGDISGFAPLDLPGQP